MYSEVKRLVVGCRTCQANKIEHARLAGLLQPHNVPNRCWDHVTTDFITELPTTKNGFDSILVMVEKLSKRVIFTPTRKKVTAEEDFYTS